MSDVQMEYNNAFDDSKELFTPEMENGNWLSSKHAQLSGTQKKGIFGNVKKDSSTFNNIKNTLSTLNGLLEKKMSGDNYDNQTTLQMAYNAYMALIQLCDNYLSDKKGGVRTARTDTGKSRIKMVNEIKQFAEKDINAVRVQMYLPDNLKGTTLKEAIGKARTKTINLETPDSEHKHVGGNANKLTVLSKEENEGEEGFYSDMKIYDLATVLSDATPFIAQVVSQTKVKKEYYDMVLNEIAISGTKAVETIKDRIVSKVSRSKFEYSKYPEAAEFADELYSVLSAVHATKVNCVGTTMANIQSRKVNFNARNVATSRIASILKKDKLIAKSEMVQLNDIQKGESRMGSVMNKAKGTEALELIKNHVKGMMNGSKTKVQKKEVDDKIKSLFTGSFQHDLADLQVIDYLCGQTDRHAKNFFIDTDEKGNFMSLQGIDNDISFGETKGKQGFLNLGYHGRKVLNENDELIIPHMSRELAINIDLFNENIARYALMDLIGKPDIEAFCVRLSRLKKAVRKELELGEESKILLNDEQWGKDSLEDFITASNDNLQNDTKDGSGNYIGIFFVKHTGLGISEVENEIAEELKKLKQK